MVTYCPLHLFIEYLLSELIISQVNMENFNSKETECGQ